jgi:membrane protease YdiL (CAAX protease family)
MELTLRSSLITLQHQLNRLIRILPACAITIFAYFITTASMSTPAYYRLFGGDPTAGAFGFQVFIPVFAALIFIVFPVIVNKFILKQSISEIGITIPKNKLHTSILTLLALLYTVPVFIYLSQQGSFQDYYKFGPTSPLFFIGMQLLLFPLYYFAEETFFRGFLFLTLWQRVGWHSYWISDILFTLAHIGKPPLEILVSIPASILFNYITLRSRSMLPSFIVHTCLGILVFSIINFHSVRW